MLSFKLLKSFTCLIVVAIAALQLGGSHAPTILETIQSKGELRILSRNGPTTYYEGPYGIMMGFEYTLAKAFADELGVELNIVEEENLGRLINLVGTDFGDLGASGLTVTDRRKQRVLFSTPYLEVTQQLLYQRGQEAPGTIEDLYGKNLMVIANSAHAERMRELKKQYPQLQWQERADLEMIDLMEMVHSGTVDYAVVDSNAFTVNHMVYPKAEVAFDISKPQQLAWAFPRQTDQTLYQAAETFFAKLEESGELERIRQQYFEPDNQQNSSGNRLFARRIESRLPRWKDLMKGAAETHTLDWRLLAAISYQESHWNARAKSPTGVRGLMMLTLATAKDMGVKNRIDPEQSIHGGARYFKSIFDRIPERIKGPDRTWLALAAYNVGFGHLEDARKITQQQGGNPDRWVDVKRSLPLLAKRKYYKQTTHGYARGWEPVSYVDNIRHFYNVLTWYEHTEQRRLAAAAQEENDFKPVRTLAEPALSLSL